MVYEKISMSKYRGELPFALEKE
jgi:hypothetical protein